MKNLLEIIRKSIQNRNQLNKLMRDPESIMDIENPSVKMQQFIAEKHPNLLLYIKDLDKDIQLKVVQSNPQNIAFIKNPSDNIQLYAVNKDNTLFHQLLKPCIKVQEKMILSNPDNINYIDNPSEKIQLLAVRQKPDIIKELKNPSENVQLSAININSSLVEYIDKPSEKVQLLAVSKNASLIKSIDSPCEKAQLLALERDVENIKFTKSPCEKAQILAVSKQPLSIGFISNPCERAQLLAVKSDLSNFLHISSPSPLCAAYVAEKITGEPISKRLSTKLIEPTKKLVESIEKSSHQDSTEKIAKARNKSIETFKKDINKEDVISSPIIESPGNIKSVAKGGNRELIVDGDRATIRTNGKDYDASKVITGLNSKGININNLSKEQMTSLLCGKKLPVPNNQKTLVGIVKGPAGYAVKAFSIAKQINHSAQQEI